MSAIKQAMEKLGGIKEVSKILECPYDTARSWVVRQNIPHKRIIELVSYAAKNGIELDVKDFF